MKQFVKCIVTLLLVAAPGLIPCYAQRVAYGDDVVVSQAVDEDIYISGGTVTVNAPVHGDLVVVGGTVTINDTVTGDIIVGGGTVRFYGYAGDDVRCAGGELYIRDHIAGDLVVAGGKVFIERNADIEGGILAGSGDITLDGNVRGNVKIGAGTFRQNGNILGDLVYKGDQATINGSVSGAAVLAANKLALGSNTSFYKGVRYWSEIKNIDFVGAVKGGTAVYDPSLEIRSGRWHYLGHATLLGFVWYLGTAFVFMLLIQFLFGAQLKSAADFAHNRTLRSLGYGLLFFIAVPIGAVLLMVTVLGIPLGFLVLLAYVVLVILATVIAALVIANWLNNWYGRSGWRYWRITGVALGVFIILKILTFIPFFGWLIMLLVACVSFGALVMNVDIRRQKASS